MANKPFKKLRFSLTGDTYSPVDGQARQNIGDLSQLETVNKSNLVEAINEAAQSGGGGTGVPSGGSKGQVLTKRSSVEGDAGWEYPPVMRASGNDPSNLTVTWNENYTVFDLYSRQELVQAYYEEDFTHLKLVKGYITTTLPDYATLYHFEFGAITEIGNDSAKIATLEVVSDSASAHSGVGVYSEAELGVSEEVIQDAVDNYLDLHPSVTGTFSNSAKRALLDLLEKVKYVDSNGSEYLSRLESELMDINIVGITASFTQGSTVIYTNDSTSILRPMLTVVAEYDDSSTEIVTDYTISGTFHEGTSTITIEYSGYTDTIDVLCTVKGWLYHFSQNILSSGSEDFNLTGNSAQYAERVTGNYAYFRAIDTTIDPSATVGLAIKAINLTKVPNFANDWTISGWSKGGSNGFNLMTAYKAPSSSTANVPTANSGVDNLASGWTVGENTAISVAYKGVRLQTVAGLVNIQLFASDENKRVWIKLTPPSSFDYSVWHHYALTRKNGVIRFFVDGAIICSVNYNHPIYFADQVSICGAFKGYVDVHNTAINTMDYYADDVFIAEYCKWDSPFDTTQILY